MHVIVRDIAYRGLLAIALLLVAAAARGDSLPTPSGPVILTVSGSITRTNGAAAARFDRAMLDSLPQHVVQTRTPWDQEVVSYGGVLGRELLRTVGADGGSVRAIALNDYTVTIPFADFAAYDVLLALTRNGEDMKVRDKGPIFIIYPFDAHPELRTSSIYGRSIWQLTSIVVE